MLRDHGRQDKRPSRFALGVATLTLGMALTPGTTTAQALTTWEFAQDPLTDLWFHGLSLVGFNGVGPTPLYDAEYAWTARSTRRERGVTETQLERARGTLIGAFNSDPAFEVLHFVPLYFSGAPIGATLDALEGESTSSARWDPDVANGARIVNAILQSPSQRSTLDVFVDALREEWRLVTAGVVDWREPLPITEFREEWMRLATGPLADFLDREGLSKGQVLLTPTLGVEGRMLVTESGALVAVGTTGDPESASGAILRELCYPAIRRVLAPFETRFEDRYEASSVSDLTATRCGELLLEARAPGYLEGYRSRFGVIASESGFLSAAGASAGAAALEGEIEQALRRELHLDSDAGRSENRPVGR